MFCDIHSVTSQRTLIFLGTAVIASDHTSRLLRHTWRQRRPQPQGTRSVPHYRRVNIFFGHGACAFGILLRPDRFAHWHICGRLLNRRLQLTPSSLRSSVVSWFLCRRPLPVCEPAVRLSARHSAWCGHTTSSTSSRDAATNSNTNPAVPNGPHFVVLSVLARTLHEQIYPFRVALSYIIRLNI